MTPQSPSAAIANEPEIWRPVPGYLDRYEVSNMGRIKAKAHTTHFGRKNPDRILSGYDRRGYQMISVKHPSGWKTVAAHRLVLIAFVGQPKPGEQTRHLDGDRRNNRLENLRYGTAEENTADKLRHGTQAKGEAITRSVLRERDVRNIRRAADMGLDTDDIAVCYDVSVHQVSQITRRKAWAHVV